MIPGSHPSLGHVIGKAYKASQLNIIHYPFTTYLTGERTSYILSILFQSVKLITIQLFQRIMSTGIK